MKYIRKFLNFLLHKSVYIFDTNILAARAKKIDSRIRKLPYFFGSFFVTEFIELEKKSLIADKGYKEIFDRKVSILSFESLREEFPDTCVLFYNFIVGMHNPAHITSPFFLNEAYLNLEKTGVRLTKEQKNIKNRLSDTMSQSTFNNLFSTGKPKSEQAIILDKAYQRHIRKKRRADPLYKNYLNDYKTIAISLINCLLKKLNTTFITADSDILIAVCNLIETVVQQMAFKYFILKKIKQEGVVRLWKGLEKFRFTMKFEEFEILLKSLLRDTFVLNSKCSSFFFRIVYWDQEKQKYIECLRMNFDEEIRDMMLHSHGHIACPFVRNSDHGNMFRYKYELMPNMILNIEVLPKAIRNIICMKASAEQHKKQCKYVQQLESGNFEYFTEFEPPISQHLFERK